MARRRVWTELTGTGGLSLSLTLIYTAKGMSFGWADKPLDSPFFKFRFLQPVFATFCFGIVFSSPKHKIVLGRSRIQMLVDKNFIYESDYEKIISLRDVGYFTSCFVWNQFSCFTLFLR
jgi:hypothetical protein